MKSQSVFKQVGLLVLLPVVVLAATMPIQAREAEPDLQSSNFITSFREIAPQGFGDRHNSKAWSMIWWKDHLYVGTARAHMCITIWALWDSLGPPLQYPPEFDPDYECAAEIEDLPLQAEIWRYSPDTRVWDRVFQSPLVPIPDDPDGKLTGRDAGFRGITTFTDLDGTEALYIGGVTSEVMFPGLIPPRILRSEDGETWEPVPHDPGTVLGDLARGNANFRGMELFNDRLYVVNGDLRGGASVLESENPAGGNDYFRWVTPDDLNVYEIAAFDDHLYVGTEAAPNDPERGYRVLKTTATGLPPYEFELVVDEGAYFEPLPSNAVIAMYVYDGRLYVGTDKPAEMIRINPAPEIPPENPWDLWDLVVGAPRDMPDGSTKYPLSEFGFGFDWIWNEHIWRMQEHEGYLYVGTNDATGFLKTFDRFESLLPKMGYDLYLSPDGVEYTMLTQTGFADEGYGDQLGIGIRVFASTPHGLYFGTSNPFYGLRIYESLEHRVYLPLVLLSQPAQGDLLSGFGTAEGGGRSPGHFGAPEHAWLENHDGAAVLSWEPVSGAARYRIYRSDFVPAQELGIEITEQDAWVPKPYSEIGTADSTFYLDRTALSDGLYHYYVRAEGSNGVLSRPSNLARSPSLNTPVTLSGLRVAAAKWMAESRVQAVAETEDIPTQLSVVDEQMAAGDLQAASESLEVLRAEASSDRLPQLSWWRAEDFGRLLGKLIRRIQLAQAGVLSPPDLR